MGFGLAESVVREAEALAARMLVTGERVRFIRSTHGAVIAAVSTDESAVHWLVKFSVGGKPFFIGHPARGIDETR